MAVPRTVYEHLHTVEFMLSVAVYFYCLWLSLYFTYCGRQWLLPVLLPNHLHTVEFPFSVAVYFYCLCFFGRQWLYTVLLPNRMEMVRKQ